MRGKHTVATAPIETKVKAATGAAVLVGVGIALLNWMVGDSQLMGSLPSWAQALATIAVPPLITFLSGWKASHTPRTDMGELTPED